MTATLGEPHAPPPAAPSVLGALACPPPAAPPPFSAPRATWPLGHLPAFRRDKIEFLARAVREHGDLVPLRFGPLRMWLIQDPAVVGEVLATLAHRFQKDIGIRRLKVLLGEGLLTAEGALHARRRNVAQPAFRRADLDPFVPAMVDLTRAAAERWLAAPGGRIDLHLELSALALSIVARALFGADLVEDAHGFGEALTEALALIDRRLNAAIPLPLWVPTPENRRLVAAKGRLDAAVFAIIRARRLAGGGGSDLLGRLIEARDPDGAPALSDEALRDEVMTLLLAGHETTAAALTFALWLLGGHPDARVALDAEAARVLGAGERPLAAEDLHHLGYAHQVFEEALRLYPPAWMMGRECAEDVTLGGGRLPLRRGDMVAWSPYLLHRDARFWPDPLAFRPERFAPGAERPVPYAYLPFGAGKRACIGRSLALMEGVVVLATLARLVDIEVDARTELRLQAHLTLRPEGGLPAVVRRASR